MSSYIGLAILVFWCITFLALTFISGNPLVLILGVTFSIPIAFLAAEFDVLIESRSKINHGRNE